MLAMSETGEFAYQGLPLTIDGAKAYAFERFETASTADLEDFAAWAKGEIAAAGGRP